MARWRHDRRRTRHPARHRGAASLHGGRPGWPGPEAGRSGLLSKNLSTGRVSGDELRRLIHPPEGVPGAIFAVLAMLGVPRQQWTWATAQHRMKDVDRFLDTDLAVVRTQIRKGRLPRRNIATFPAPFGTLRKVATLWELLIYTRLTDMTSRVAFAAAGHMKLLTAFCACVRLQRDPPHESHLPGRAPAA